MAENKNTSADELHQDLSPLLKHYKDGRVERFVGLEIAPPTPLDQETNVQSKDIFISPENNLSARLYLPKNNPNSKKLPLLIYFHGGGFVLLSAFSPLYHNHLNHLVSHTQMVTLSVNYRLAPEHPLPAAYEDSWETLKWVASESQNDDWVREFADLDRVYLGGDSAGANIAHHTAVRLGSSEKIDGVNVIGAFLNCPYFLGKDPLPSEEEDDDPVYPRSFLAKQWRCAYPNARDCDHPWIIPGKDAAISSLGCKKILVYVAEKDALKSRGWYYKDVVVKSGWNGEIDVVEVDGEGHVFSVAAPASEKAIAMFERLASFVDDQQ